MKTLSYHTANEIRIGMMVALFTAAIFASVRIRELQVNDMNSSEKMRSDRIEVIHKSFPILPVADAKLIEEPTYEPGTSLTSTDEKELSIKMKTWINNNTYWNDETAANKEELALQMESWLQDGAYWSKDNPDEEQLLASQMEAWIGNGEYWRNE